MGKENQFRTVLSVSVSEQIRQNGPEDSSHMNKTVMFVQKLESTSNWVSRKGAAYAFFFVATEARSVRGARTSATGEEFSLVLRLNLLAWKKRKNTHDFSAG